MKFATAMLFFILMTACNKDTSKAASVDNKTTPHPEAAIPAPSYFHPLDIGLTKVIVGWEDKASAYEYELRRDGKFLTKVPAGLFTYIDTAVSPHKTYRYTLTALNRDGKRSPPVALTVTTQENSPPEIKQIKDTILLSSDQPVHHTFYQVYASDADNHSLNFTLRGDTHTLFNVSSSGELSLVTHIPHLAGKTSKLAIDVSDGFSTRTVTLAIGVIPVASSMVRKGIVRQVYQDDSMTNALDTLKNLTHFPHKPTLTTFESAFKSPSNHGKYYGQQMHGFLIPPSSGEYTFWIASDDQSELSLSTSADSNDATIIARVPGWTSPEDWTDYDVQQSESIHLEGGKAYYIKALMTEGSGDDHLAVAWQGPTITQAIIAGDYLRAPLDFNAPDNVTAISWVKTQENAGILSWKPAYDDMGIAHYEIYHEGALLSTTEDENINLTDLKSGKKYQFSINAVDHAGNRSSLSLSPTIIIDDFIAPTPPLNLQVVEKSFHEIALAWQASTDENHQAILYRLFKNNVHVASTYDTHARIDKLYANTEYTIMVQAIDLAGNLSESDIHHVSTQTIPPSAPVFDYPHYRFGLFSNALIGTVFGRLEAYDTNNSTLSYTFIDGNEQGYFTINAQGEISLQKVFSSSHPQQFELTLQASNDDTASNTLISISVLPPMTKDEGGVSQEVWASTTDTQLNEFNFSLPMQREQTLTDFESLENMGSRYTQRLRGFLNVPESGLYSFWITSDDGSQLRISQDMSTEKTQMVASISRYTSSGDRWPDYSRDIDSVYLHKGQLYFIEAIHHELGGSDHLSVGFTSETMSEKALLTGDYLIPFSQWMPAKPQIQTAYQAGFSNQGNQITIDFTLKDSAAGLPVTVYYGEMDAGESVHGWLYANTLGHLTAGNHTFTLNDIEPGKTYFIRIAVEGPAGISWSTSAVELGTVITDPTKQAGEALPQSLDITVIKNNQEYAIALEKHSIRSPHFQLLTFDSRRLQQFKPLSPMPEPRTYRGTVIDNPYLTVTGVVDAEGLIHLSFWRGDSRAFGESVDVSAYIDTQALGNNETHNDEIIIDRVIPPVTNNRFYLPPTGSEFHNYLARVSFKHEYPQFVANAESNVIHALAQMEGHINEVDYIWAQKTGLRWDMGRALIEVHGDSTAEDVQARPAANDSTNFSIEFQDPAGGGYCWGGGDWVGCVANYTMNWGFTHEIGHNMGLGHGEQTDNNNQMQAPGTHMGNMQSWKTLRRLQTGTKFPPTQPIQQPMLPAAFKDYLSVYQNESGAIHPLANDYDANGDSLAIDTFDATTQKGGIVSRVNNALHYTPPTGFIGVDQMTYTVTDGQYKTVGAIQIQVLANGITGDWNMDTLSDNKILDQSGRENHLSAPDLININATDQLGDLWVSGISDFAMGIPLVADATMQPDALGHQLLPHKLDPGHKSFSASIWFKYSHISGSKLIIGKSSNGPNNLTYGGWEIRSGGETGHDLIIQVNFRDRLMAKNSVAITQANAISDGIWHHVVMVLDRESTALRGYIDGVAFDQTGALPEGQSPVIAAMNTSGYGGGSPFKVGGHTAIMCESAETEGDPDICQAAVGQAIDLVKLFHKPLTLDEVNALYAEQ